MIPIFLNSNLHTQKEKKVASEFVCHSPNKILLYGRQPKEKKAIETKINILPQPWSLVFFILNANCKLYSCSSLIYFV
jgi:hypothetical protein